jgi:hypothetical protein
VIAAYYVLTAPDRTYVQVLVGASPSEAATAEEIHDCVERAVAVAIDREAVIEVAVVSGVPSEMHWRRIDAHPSLLTRMTPKASERMRETARQDGLDAAADILAGPAPPGSSDHLAALATAAGRARDAADSVSPSGRVTVLCADAHFTGTGGDSYDDPLDDAGVASILDSLRADGLLPDWEQATLVFGAETTDRVVQVDAPREAAIRRFWSAWADASRVELASDSDLDASAS